MHESGPAGVNNERKLKERFEAGDRILNHLCYYLPLELLARTRYK